MDCGIGWVCFVPVPLLSWYVLYLGLAEGYGAMLASVPATVVLTLTIVFELKQDLSKNNLVPDLIQTENNAKEGAASRDNIQKQAYLAEIIRKLINFVYSGNFLGAPGL